jgi:hypothetical protein
MNRLALALPLAIAAGALAALPDDATGCAAVPHPNQSVSIAEESALIVWEPKSKTEHFIRRASFRSTGYDIGFLVPTPGRPDLGVASDDLFNELASVTAPKVEYRELIEKRAEPFALGCTTTRAEFAAGEALPASRAERGGVDVLEQRRVGDYDAAVLAFRKGDGDSPEKGAEELAKWLAEHGYQSSGATQKWLEQYVQGGWCVTAFKIASPEPPKGRPGAEPNPNPPERPGELRAKPVRMSFRAEQPFYPYREPEAEQQKAAGEPRLLRVFVAAPGRFAGTLGDGAKPWPGQAVWAGPLDAGRWATATRQAGLGGAGQKNADGATPGPDLPAADGLWLTEFEDRSSPRPGTDEVYFEPATERAPVERPPHVVTTKKVVTFTPAWHAAVYYGVPAALVLGALAAWRLRKR